MSQTDMMLADEVSKYMYDPLGFCLFAWQWGEEGSPLKGFSGPSEWQKEILQTIGGITMSQRFNGVDAVDPIQVAISSGHG